MAEKYDPVPDLALLLDAAARAGWSALPYVDRLTERLGPGSSAGPEAAEKLLRQALGLKACQCILSGGELLPLACPVHGTPCEFCGGLQYCAEECDGEASDYRTVDLIPDRYGRLVKVASTGTEVVIVPPPEAGALFFGAERRDRFAEAVARAVTPGRVPVKHGPGCRCTPCLAEPSYRTRREVAP